MGTYGSRSGAVGISALVKALDKVEVKAKKVAAQLMEASEGDIVFKDMCIDTDLCFSFSYYDTESDAEAHYTSHSGRFIAWIKRGNFWMKAPLRVRYVKNVAEGFIIRCKLNIPNVDDTGKPRYWEHDGLVKIENLKVFWVFETRQVFRHEHFYFITEILAGGRKESSGTYLTVDQDGRQATVSDVIILERVAGTDTDDEAGDDAIRQFMHETAKIVHQGDEDWGHAQDLAQRLKYETLA